MNIGDVLPWMSDHLEAEEETCQTKEGRFRRRRRRRRADDSPSLRLEFSGGEDEMARNISAT